MAEILAPGPDSQPAVTPNESSVSLEVALSEASITNYKGDVLGAYETIRGALTNGATPEAKALTKVSRLAQQYRREQIQGKFSTVEQIGEPSAVVPPKEIKHPMPVEASDIAALSISPAAERIQVLAEITDACRFRTDPDAPETEKTARLQEIEMILPLLKGLPESPSKDLLALEAWRFFLDRHIRREDLAEEALAALSSKELADLCRQILEQHKSPEERVKSLEKAGKTCLLAIERRAMKWHGLDEKGLEALKEEAASVEFNVVIHIGTSELTKALFESHRLLGHGDIETSKGTPDRVRRDHIEEASGRRDADDILAEHVIFGLAVVGERSKVIGMGSNRYGRCVVGIKPEVAERRTTYSYGDSLRDSSERTLKDTPNVMTRAEAAEATLIHERVEDARVRKASTYYVEAQILGGVDIEDIAFISLPFEIGRNDLAVRIAKEFPHIEVIVRVPERWVERYGQERIEAEAGALGLSVSYETIPGE